MDEGARLLAVVLNDLISYMVLGEPFTSISLSLFICKLYDVLK